ncbi:hypothetical protein RND81_08G130700 [Saponaria officinalis]|uniref:peptide-methionine (S)-S-oxide reductase n=1 Tax=Saponaria officinalis TaxID=3572 RepID=A0AAW1J8F5_SAPOF
MAEPNPALDPNSDNPVNPGLELAQFGAGCFWGVELAFQRLNGVVKTEVGYSQGHVPDPNYRLVCSGTTNHVEVIRVHFYPNVCPYTNLLHLFWSRHDPTTVNRQKALHWLEILILQLLMKPTHILLRFMLNSENGSRVTAVPKLLLRQE